MVDPGFEHEQVEANGISIHTVSMGEGPLVVFCHGFPESWYSWRHQLPAVAAAGFRALAMDMRGYGKTSAPGAVDAYSMSHLVGDVVGVVNAVGAGQAVVVGHDWGAPVAWCSALMRPDLFRAVAALSVPYIAPFSLPEGLTMNDLMPQLEAHTGQEANAIRVFPIAYGKDASKQVLDRIADSSDGVAAKGDTENIESVYRDISSFF